LGHDQNRTFLYVVDEKNEVAYRPVKLGPEQDGLQVIEEGLAKDERVVLNGLQRIIRPGMKVEPKVAQTPAAGRSPAPLATKPDVPPGKQPSS
jgi:membrane fusion protein, multidrug efflux system